MVRISIGISEVNLLEVTIVNILSLVGEEKGTKKNLVARERW